MKKLFFLLAFVFPSLLFTNLCYAQFTDIHDFGNGLDGATPLGTLVRSGNVLYGMTEYGGANLNGNIFSIHVDGSGYTDLHDFDGTDDGSNPQGSLIIYKGVLYGMNQFGGTNNSGVIFKLDSDGSHFDTIWNFGPSVAGTTNGCEPYGDLIISGGQLFGMTELGGLNDGGLIFSIDTNGSDYKDVWDFDAGGTNNGSNPYSSLTLKGYLLYGMTSNGGVNSRGNVFVIDSNGSNYRDLWDFSTSVTNGEDPRGNVIISGNKLYGMTVGGGVNSDGNIFSIDTNGGGYKDRWDFDAGGDTNGSFPFGSFIVAGKVLFGMTANGGVNTVGNIFSIDTDGANTYTDLFDFNSTNGSYPSGSLLYYNGIFYGMTAYGGAYSSGNIFSDTVLSIRTTDTTITCNGDNNGRATVYATGSIAPPLTYSWTGGGGTNTSVTGLSAGDYTVTVADTDGITLTAGVDITEPGVLTTSITSHSNALCNGGTGSATAAAATGGTTPYTYHWTPSGGNTTSATGLSAGSYTITVTDNHGCSVTAGVAITEPTAITATTYSKPDDGSSDGVAAVTPSGGVPPYTYSWNPGGATTDTIKGLHGPRSFCCTITDSHGCNPSSDTICVIVISDAGIGNISNASSINIYPDPNNGHFTVAGVMEGQRIEVYDYMGQKVSSVMAGNNSALQFNIADRSNGIYLIRILNTDGSLVKEMKIVKTQ